MTWDEWEAEFRPVTVSGDYLLDTYGEDLATVNAADPARVWTVVDGGGSYLDLIDGMHYVDRLGYVITHEPAAPGVAYYVTNRTDN
jgi:hypothetical protein